MGCHHSDGHACQSLDKDLHATAESQLQVPCAVLLNVAIAQGTMHLVLADVDSVGGASALVQLRWLAGLSRVESARGRRAMRPMYAEFTLLSNSPFPFSTVLEKGWSVTMPAVVSVTLALDSGKERRSEARSNRCSDLDVSSMAALSTVMILMSLLDHRDRFDVVRWYGHCRVVDVLA
jgi:hypothetical protein